MLFKWLKYFTKTKANPCTILQITKATVEDFEYFFLIYNQNIVYTIYVLQSMI